MFGNYSSIICAQLYQRYLNNKIFEFIQRKKPLYINFFFFVLLLTENLILLTNTSYFQYFQFKYSITI